MPYNKIECVNHIQKVIDWLYAFESWEDSAFVKALALGVQGKKREARLAETKYGNVRKYLQSTAGDFFLEETGEVVEIYPNPTTVKFPHISDPESFLTEYRSGLRDMCYKLHEAANTLVAPLCLRKMSKPLYELSDCLFDEVVDLNRAIKRYADMKKHGTALHDLFIYETSDHNVHDTAEKREAKSGYDY